MLLLVVVVVDACSLCPLLPAEDDAEAGRGAARTPFLIAPRAPG
jgi:hypothetical protein